MHNVKTFLEEGKFVDPAVAAREAGGGRGPELLHVSHKSQRFGGRAIRYVVVEGVEKFRPDYWDRVACVFTTGTLPPQVIAFSFSSSSSFAASHHSIHLLTPCLVLFES
jgi:hypothetical protein